ncbi:MAG: hypothetical protein QMD01_04565 [Thermodesulfovibrionales bacterium]|nr:hypothetical protein [Thermodesulfovibrionales bacterium]
MSVITIKIIGFGIMMSFLFFYSGEASANETQKLFEVKCSQCHTIEYPKSERHDLQGWTDKVNLMRSYGCKLTDEEANKIIDYLTKTYPKK